MPSTAWKKKIQVEVVGCTQRPALVLVGQDRDRPAAAVDPGDAAGVYLAGPQEPFAVEDQPAGAASGHAVLPLKPVRDGSWVSQARTRSVAVLLNETAPDGGATVGPSGHAAAVSALASPSRRLEPVVFFS